MTIPVPPTPPSQSDPTNFNTRADAWLAWEQALYAALNATLEVTNANLYRTVDLVDTAGGALATAYANGQTLDGVTITTGMRILRAIVGGNATNGIYDAPASGTASRSADATSEALLSSGCTISVTRGTNYAQSVWRNATTPGFTVGSTSLSFISKEERGSITLTDASGAGLSFSAASCIYSKIGDRVFVEGGFLYPPTASGSASVIGGLPYTVASTSGLGMGSNRTSNVTDPALIQPLAIVNTKTFRFLQHNGNVANSVLSEHSVSFQFSYRTSE